jgi:ketosteroid isomerase-like protein
VPGIWVKPLDYKAERAANRISSVWKGDTVRQRFFLVAVLGFAIAGSTGEARRVQDYKGVPAVDPALKKAADARTVARDTADADNYARYTLDDAWLVSPSGGFRRTQQNVDDLRRAGGGLPSSNVSEDQYRMFRDTAIRTYRRVATGPEGQKSVKRFLETWVKERGQWKLAAEWYREITEQ